MEKEDSDCVVQKVCCGVRAGVLKSNRKLVWVQRSSSPPHAYLQNKSRDNSGDCAAKNEWGRRRPKSQ